MGNNKRNPFLAFVFSLFFPGLGQMYNGFLKKGLMLSIVRSILLLLVLFSLKLYHSSHLVNIIFILCMFGALLMPAIEAVVGAMKKEEERKVFPHWAYWGFGICTVLFILFPTYLIAKIGFVSAYSIPTGTMHNSILVGDNILSFNTDDSYSWERHDVVVHTCPLKNNTKYVKRIVGMPGEKIKLYNESVFINGEKLRENKAGIFYDSFKRNNFYTDIIEQEVYIPQKGDTLGLTVINDVREMQNVMSVLLQDESPEDISIDVQLWGVYKKEPLRNISDQTFIINKIDPQNPRAYNLKRGDVVSFNSLEPFSQVPMEYGWSAYADEFACLYNLFAPNLENYKLQIRFVFEILNNDQPYHLVENDYYFLMGDNRNNSFDSQYKGFVCRKNLIGRPALVYFSVPYKGASWAERIKRIGKPIL